MANGKKKKKRNESLDFLSSQFYPQYQSSDTHPFGFVEQLANNEVRMRAGREIPDYMILDKHHDRGLYFGAKSYMHGEYVGKPQDFDGSVLVLGGPGSSKTRTILEPSTYTWVGHQVIIDVKPTSALINHCVRSCKLNERRIKVFSPANLGRHRYDPFSFIRFDGEDNISKNMKDLAMTLVSQLSNNDSVWSDSATTLLTAAMVLTV